ncbi:MAG: methyltransferase domain-containing protein [Streptosporangiaceae bacterium]
MTADDRPPAAGQDGPAAARAALASQLAGPGLAVSPAVAAAFGAVPRHLFLPGMPPAAAYADQAFVIKYGADGLPASSSSQPAIMAIMLEQLGLQPGHRVLEIGTGTGYNAALMAQITGGAGSVDTIDIDAELIAGARESLAAAGASGVRVHCGDGGFGLPDHAPYDRIIVTAGAWSLAPQWLAQLAPGGRIVLPLSVRGLQLSAAFTRAGQAWSAASAVRCGFIRMAGALAGPEQFVPLGPQPGWLVQADDGRALDCDALYRALGGPAADLPAGLRVAGAEQLGDLDLWLAFAEPRLARITLLDARRAPAAPSPLMPLGGLAAAAPGAQPGSVAAAALAVPPGGLRGDRGPQPSAAGEQGQPEAAAGKAAAGAPGEPEAAPPRAREATVPGEPAAAAPEGLPVLLRGYGPAAAELAGYLAGRALDWDGLGRPGTRQLHLTVIPRGAPAPAGSVILDRGELLIAARWPAPGRERMPGS